MGNRDKMGMESVKAKYPGYYRASKDLVTGMRQYLTSAEKNFLDKDLYSFKKRKSKPLECRETTYTALEHPIYQDLVYIEERGLIFNTKHKTTIPIWYSVSVKNDGRYAPTPFIFVHDVDNMDADIHPKVYYLNNFIADIYYNFITASSDWWATDERKRTKRKLIIMHKDGVLTNCKPDNLTLALVSDRENTVTKSNWHWFLEYARTEKFNNMMVEVYDARTGEALNVSTFWEITTHYRIPPIYLFYFMVYPEIEFVVSENKGMTKRRIRFRELNCSVVAERILRP